MPVYSRNTSHRVACIRGLVPNSANGIGRSVSYRSGSAHPASGILGRGVHKPLPLLEAVENELNAGRDSEFVVNMQQIVPYDLLLARDWPPSRVAVTAYGITATFCAIASWGVRHESRRFCVAAAFSCCFLLGCALRLGALRSGNEIPARQIVTREIERDTTVLD